MPKPHTVLSLPTKIVAFTCLSLGTVFAAANRYADYVIEEKGQASMQRVLDAYAPKRAVMVTDDIRLDGIRAGVAGKQVIFSLTLLSSNAVDVSKEKWLGMVKTTQCGAHNNTRLQPFAKNGVTLIYEYVGRDGQPIGSIYVRPADMI